MDALWGLSGAARGCLDGPGRQSRPFEDGKLASVLPTCDHLALLCQMVTPLITVSCLLPFQLGVSSDVRTHTGGVHLHPPPPRALSLKTPTNASSAHTHQRKPSVSLLAGF